MTGDGNGGNQARRRRIAALLACHNRCTLTLAAIAALRAQRLPAGLELTVILVDDGSTDGTARQVAERFPEVRILAGDGTLFWNGAMTLAQRRAMADNFDFHLWLNDDVALHDTAIADLLRIHDQQTAAAQTAPIVVGSTLDGSTGQPSYGGHSRRPGVHPFRFMRLFADGERALPCDTFNGNCVLVPRPAFERLGPIDPAFAGGQPLGDTDYGLRAGQAGIPMLLAPQPVGTCQSNPRTTPWENPDLPLGRRLGALCGPLGPLRRQTAHFYRRHGGPAWVLWWLINVGRCLRSALFVPPRRTGKLRFAMIEPVLPWYRVPLLTRLRDRDHIHCTLYHGNAHPDGEADAVPPQGVEHRHGRNLYLPFGLPRILWSCHTWAVLRGRYDVVMMAEHVYTLSNWLIWLVSRILGRPRVILTGHFSLERKPPGLVSRLRRMWLRGADYLAPYTPGGARECLAIGIPPHRIQVLHNTLDVEAIRLVAARAGSVSEDERRSMGVLGKRVFLFVGRLYREKLAPLAAEAVAQLSRQGHAVALLVVGDGQDRAVLERLCAAGAPVAMLGRCHDEERLARLFAMAEAVIMPDAAGLAINHAFAHGVPVILGPGRHHGVETEYVRHEVNGLMADALTAEALAAQMRRLLDQPELAARLRADAAQTADELGMDGYAARLEELVERAARD